MLVYKATKKEFLEDFRKEEIIGKIIQNYTKNISKPNYTIMNSWNGSIPYLYLLLEDESIPDNCGISIEQVIPNIDTKKRIDVMITGKNRDKQNVAIIIELKQWSKVKQPADKIGYIVLSDRKEKILRTHPSFQVHSYLHFFKTYNNAFITNNIQTYSCAFLHNYELNNNDVLLDEKYNDFINKSPLFFRGDMEKLRSYINDKICEGDNCKIIDVIENSYQSITRLLTPRTVDIIKSPEVVTLIDEQEIVCEKALEMAKQSMLDNKKRVFIVKGGPGTGKSVLAMKILADISTTNKGKKISFVTPIQAQRNVYKYVVKKDNIYKDISERITNPGKFTKAIKNANDVIIVDEAHRLKEKSGRFKDIGKDQTMEIIVSSKFSMFFIDDLQRITLEDKGSVAKIIETAKEQDAIIEQFELASQFRCQGLSSYISWIEDVLQIRNTANYNEIDSIMGYIPRRLRRAS